MKVVGGKHNVLVHYVDVSVPTPSGTVGHGNMTCWPKCNVCVLEEGKNKVSMRDHDPRFICYGYRMND